VTLPSRFGARINPGLEAVAENGQQMTHRSADVRRKAVALVHYIDDSGSDEQSKLAAMGGPVFAQHSRFPFHYEWDRLLAKHGVQPPVHMKEFSPPNGCLSQMKHPARRALFADLVYLINKNKAYSLTVAVDNLEFQQFFPAQMFRGLFGPAPLAFLWCMILNHGIFDDHKYTNRLPYVVATSHFNPEITDCHAFFESFEIRNDKRYSGSLTFSTPEEDNALQAADMVSWANRRKHLGKPFKDGFEPLELLTRYVESDKKPVIHFHYPADKRSTETLAAVLGSPVRERGKRRSLLGRVPQFSLPKES
jgi:hypothetical protein